MSDRDSTPTTPIDDGRAAAVSTAPTESPYDDAAPPAADPYAPAADSYTPAPAADPYAPAPAPAAGARAPAAMVATEPRKPFFRRTGALVGLAAVALLLLGLIFGAGFAAGRISSGFGDGRSEVGPGGGFGPRDGTGPGQDGPGQNGRNGSGQDSDADNG